MDENLKFLTRKSFFLLVNFFEKNKKKKPKPRTYFLHTHTVKKEQREPLKPSHYTSTRNLQTSS